LIAFSQNIFGCSLFQARLFFTQSFFVFNVFEEQKWEMENKNKNVTCLQIDDFKFGHVHGLNKKNYDKFKKIQINFYHPSMMRIVTYPHSITFSRLVWHHTTK